MFERCVCVCRIVDGMKFLLKDIFQKVELMQTFLKWYYYICFLHSIVRCS